jgi:hypothetical protein
MIGGFPGKINMAPNRVQAACGDPLVGAAHRLLIEAGDREHDPLPAQLHMLHLPDQLLDVGAGGLRVDAGLLCRACCRSSSIAFRSIMVSIRFCKVCGSHYN